MCLFMLYVSGIEITIQGSSQFVAPDQPYILTCTFASNVISTKHLKKNDAIIVTLQLGLNKTCYNILNTGAVVCEPSICFCSQEEDIFTAKWSFASINEPVSSWVCQEGTSSSPTLILKKADRLKPTARIMYVDNSLSVTDGTAVTLQCEVEGGNPLAVISWICFCGTVTNASEAGIARSNITFTASRFLNGKLCVCNATHPASVIQNDSVQIIVTTKPDPPINLEVFQTKQKTIILKWERGSYSYNQQTFVILVQNIMSGSSRKNFVNGDVKKTYFSFEVDDLLLSTTYKIQIYSMNEFGNSSFLSVMVLVTPELHDGSNNKTDVIALSAVIAILLVLIVCLISIIWRRGCFKEIREQSSDVKSEVSERVIHHCIESDTTAEHHHTYQTISNTESQGYQNESRREIDTYESLHSETAAENQNTYQELRQTRVPSQSVTMTEDTVYIMNNVVGQVTCTLNGYCGGILYFCTGVSSQSVTITEDTVYIMNNVVGQVTCTLNGNCSAISWILSSITAPVATAFVGYSCQNSTNGYYQTCEDQNYRYTLHFTGTTNLHGQTITCYGEGCTPQNSVSDTVTISIIVPVSSVFLEGITGQEITITSGQSKSITCITGASRPASRILWYIGLTNVTSLSTETQISSRELFYTRSILTFIPTQSQNGLQVNCKAYNTDNNMVELTTKPILNIQYGPGQVILSPSSLDYIVNETYQIGPIKCSATCKPPCYYKWIIPNQDFIEGDTLMINSTQRTQSGTYKCQAYNTVGTQNSSGISIIVHYAAAVTRLEINNGNNFTIPEHSTKTITCLAEGLPQPSITLRYISNNSIIKSVIGLRLDCTFPLARCEDTGIYKCEATNNFTSRLPLQRNIFVLCQPRLGQKSLQHNFFLSSGGSLNITVQYVAYPRPTFHWFKKVSGGSSVQITDDQQDVQIKNSVVNTYTFVTELIRTNLQENGFGTYILRSSNIIGTSENVFTVRSLADPIIEASSTTGVVVGVTLAAAVALITIAVVVIFLLRRYQSAKGVKDIKDVQVDDRIPRQEEEFGKRNETNVYNDIVTEDANEIDSTTDKYTLSYETLQTPNDQQTYEQIKMEGKTTTTVTERNMYVNTETC
ncbi:hypothetical protein KUTeg_011275 [Tegillarca granosa]|uniref:Uncharacterized protein n=1 Tax=Tegillarca granosa TaxID=220873 RepID=A0ABQ9F1G0_TEGGR|nr:hypothetical protein KUTeg_011275 [Tegillarca granosa]